VTEWVTEYLPNPGKSVKFGNRNVWIRRVLGLDGCIPKLDVAGPSPVARSKSFLSGQTVSVSVGAAGKAGMLKAGTLGQTS
jgi:hypothetical protein